MIGDTVISDGIEFEVVWSGGEGLVAPRQSKVGDTWTAPPRLYNKSGKYAKKVKAVAVDNPDVKVEAANLEDVNGK